MCSALLWRREGIIEWLAGGLVMMCIRYSTHPPLLGQPKFNSILFQSSLLLADVFALGLLWCSMATCHAYLLHQSQTEEVLAEMSMETNCAMSVLASNHG